MSYADPMMFMLTAYTNIEQELHLTILSLARKSVAL